MKKTLLVLTALLFLSSCITKSSVEKNVLVLDYSDFGPAAMSEPLLGQSWWQWQNHGDSRPAKYDIKVIVYRNEELKDIKNLYPVAPNKQKDYRYVHYQNSIDYLDKHIKENVTPKSTITLKKTRKIILEHF